jgi:hypothetical protein
MGAGPGLVLALVVVCDDVIIVFKSTRRGMTMMAHGHQNRNAEEKQKRKRAYPGREGCCGGQVEKQSRRSATDSVQRVTVPEVEVEWM